MPETQFAVRWTENGARRPTVTVTGSGSREDATNFIRFLRAREQRTGVDHKIELLTREIPDWKVRPTA